MIAAMNGPATIASRMTVDTRAARLPLLAAAGLGRDLCALASRLRETDRDRLLARLDLVLTCHLVPHLRLDGATRSLAVSRHAMPPLILDPSRRRAYFRVATIRAWRSGSASISASG